MTVPEKIVATLKRATKKSVWLKGYTIKEDGTIRLTDTSKEELFLKSLNHSYNDSAYLGQLSHSQDQVLSVSMFIVVTM